ncbi:hypothetical protein A6A27_36860 [Micromonospora sp. CB01531]|nr:hypothetical protein A6A27_36860 [Micromonospora sp. CB01531]
MREPDTAGSDWRDRWANRENRRRWRAYEDTVEVWSLQGIRLLRLRAEAENLPAESPADLPVDLADGEVVVAVQPKAELVEVQPGRHADLPVPELAVLPVRRTGRARRLPHGLRVADAGTAVVTDRRVILLGRKDDREWAFPLLSGLAHYPTVPITLLHTADGRPLAGLRVPVDDAARFRLRLTIAYADAIGRRPTVLARLDRAVAANRRSVPPLPMLATAEQAPARARLAHPAIAAAAVALIALPAYAMIVDSGRPDDSRRIGVGPPPRTALPEPETGTPSGNAPTTASPAPATTTPGRAAGAPTLHPVAPRRSNPIPRPSAPAPRPVTQPAPPPDAGPGPGRPTPAPPNGPEGHPTPADRCGAPTNPYGYTYCAGELVHEPAADVCNYFTCVEGFWAGKGYMIVCDDGRIGMAGGPTGRCPEHAGRKDPVYAAVD